MSSDVHISPTWHYVAVFGALMILTLITVAVSFLHLGWANDLVALGVAVAKASLVILFFMHVKYGSRLNKLVVLGGVVWLMIMFGLTLTDYLWRDQLVQDPPGIPAAAEALGGQ